MFVGSIRRSTDCKVVGRCRRLSLGSKHCRQLDKQIPLFVEREYDVTYIQSA